MVLSLTSKLIKDPLDRYVVEQTIREGKRHWNEYRKYLREQVRKIRFGDNSRLSRDFNFGAEVSRGGGGGGESPKIKWSESRLPAKDHLVATRSGLEVVSESIIHTVDKGGLTNSRGQSLDIAIVQKPFQTDENPTSG